MPIGLSAPHRPTGGPVGLTDLSAVEGPTGLRSLTGHAGWVRATVAALVGCWVADNHLSAAEKPIGHQSALQKPRGTYFCFFFATYLCD